MKLAELSTDLETWPDKNHVNAIKKVLRAYEQTFSADVDVMDIFTNIEVFFKRLQDRYENAFTVRNILTGQLKVLDLPVVKEQLENEQHKSLQDVTRAKLSGFTKTTNDKQRLKDKRVEQPEIDTLEAQPDVEVSSSQPPTVTGGPVEEQYSIIQTLQARVHKLEGLVSALKIIIDLVD